MSSYPYLLSQLPSLRFKDTEFPSAHNFLEQAEKWLTESEFDTLKSADLNDYYAKDHSLELLKEWSEFENKLRKDLANYRESHRHGHDHKTHMFPTSVVKDENPLQAELKLLEMRWKFLTERQNVHYDDLIAVVIYSLQLQILERKASFDPEIGKEKFEKLAGIEKLNINLEGFRWENA
jgi:hypothetical protein